MKKGAQKEKKKLSKNAKIILYAVLGAVIVIAFIFVLQYFDYYRAEELENELAGELASLSAFSGDGCVPNCGSGDYIKECGYNGCDGSCGTCSAGYICNEEGKCVQEAGNCSDPCMRDYGDGCEETVGCFRCGLGGSGDYRCLRLGGSTDVLSCVANPCTASKSGSVTGVGCSIVGDIARLRAIFDTARRVDAILERFNCPSICKKTVTGTGTEGFVFCPMPTCKCYKANYVISCKLNCG